MKYHIGLLATSLLLAGCQSQPVPEVPTALSADELQDNLYSLGYAPEVHKVTLASYAEQIVFGLHRNGQMPTKGSIAVASYVDFDDSLRRTNMLGNQLAENLTLQLQQFGYVVSETKALPELVITPEGDYVLSRQQQSLKIRNHFCCILTGTLIYAPTGIEVNSRLFDSQNHTLISSSQVTIPYFVTRHLGIVR